MTAQSSDEPTPNPPDLLLPAAHATEHPARRTRAEHPGAHEPDFDRARGRPGLQREVLIGLVRSLHDDELDQRGADSLQRADV